MSWLGDAWDSTTDAIGDFWGGVTDTVSNIANGAGQVANSVMNAANPIQGALKGVSHVSQQYENTKDNINSAKGSGGGNGFFLALVGIGVIAAMVYMGNGK